MRLLFLFVLLVNVGFVSWELSRSNNKLATPEVTTDIPGIELLSEAGQATKNPTEKPVEVAVKAPEVVKQVQPKKQVATKKQTVVTPAKAVTKSKVDRCYTLGPFRELDNLRTFTRAIKDYVSAASFRSREEQEQSMFWVYLAPSASMKKAKALGKRLKNKKVKDYYVIADGAKKKGISLGHFKEKDRAYAHTESIKKLGFKPKVEAVFRSYTIYWLDYEVPAGKKIPKKIFTKHLTKKINRLDRSCS